MRGQSAVQRHEAVKTVKLVPAQELAHQGREIHAMIARRAYALFESRGWVHGHDFDDWSAAESEVLQVCRHDVKESAEAVMFRAELPSLFTADQLKVSVEPRRLTVSGEKEFDLIRAVEEPAHNGERTQRVFRVEELPADVDPSRTTAKLAGATLEIVMPKVTPPGRRGGVVEARRP